jgi:Permuted papain-like amidase enzyme, YaeF/YiiX, C92 family
MRKRRDESERSTQSAWLFDVANLRAGDVVLERGLRWTSRIIRAADRGKYSHALIFLGGTDFLEAVNMGSRVITYLRVVITDPSAWVVLRHPDAQTAERAAHKARNLAHKKYGKIAAIRSILPFRFKDDPSCLFCSQLVAEAYQRAGVILVRGKVPRQITPRLLHDASALKPLQQIPIRKQLSRNVAPLDRDAGYANSVTAEEMRASQNAFDAVQPELDRLSRTLEVSPIPGSLTELFQFLMQAEAEGKDVAPVVEQLERALEHEEYFDLSSRSARQAEAVWRLKLEFARSEQASALDRSDLAREAAELVGSYRSLLLRVQGNAQRYQNAFEKSRSRLWSRLAQMSGETAQSAHNLLNIAQTVFDEFRQQSTIK